MANETKLAVILHADVVGSTNLVQRDEHRAHDRIRDAFRRLSDTIQRYSGVAHEVRGDALVAEFARPSDAVTAATEFQTVNDEHNREVGDDVLPVLRVGVALGEVIVADGTVTGAGVVLAQRLEQLAPPGEICVSAAVREAIPERLTSNFLDLGEHELKGFTIPQKVYRIPLLGVPPSGTQDEPGNVVPEQQNSGARQPSIAILPLENLSSDAEKDYFVDGVAEDLITELTRFRWLSVIPRATAFAYRGRVADVREVARELDAGYVLEGSLRKAGHRIRVAAQLIDGVTGEHVWAERYDRNLDDIFELQDELTRSIATAISPQLYAAESARSRTKAQDLTAWDLFLQAREKHYDGSREANEEAVALARRALELEPDNVGALYIAASALYIRIPNKWASDLRQEFTEALQYAERAVELDNRDARGYRILGLLYLGFRQFPDAMRSLETAIELNGSYPEAMASLGTCCFYVGEPERGVDLVERAIALSPRDPEMTYWRCTLSLGYLLTGQYEKGIESGKYCASRKQFFAASRWYWAANSACANNEAETEAARREVLRVAPDLSLKRLHKDHPFQHPEDFNILADGLRRARLLES